MSKKGKSIDGLSGGKPTQKMGIKRPTVQSKNQVANTLTSKRPKTVDRKVGLAPTPAPSKKKGDANDFLKPLQSYDFDLNEDDLKKGRRQKNQFKGGKKKRGWKNWSKKRKILTIVGAVLLALIIGLAIWLQILIASLTNGNSGLFDSLNWWDDGIALKRDKNNRTNIVLFGTSGYDMQGSEGDGEHDGSQLTDSIMVVSLDQDTKDVAMLSLPRDLKVTEGCAAGKINEIYWCNNQDGQHEIQGATALNSEIQEILDLEIHYYVHSDWAAIIEVVNALGGITVTLDEDIADPMTNTYIPANTPTLINGDQALGLARARHGTIGGDFSRGASQQKILVAIEQKLLEQGLNLSNALQMVNTIGDNVRMNFKTDEIKRLVKIFKEFDPQNLRQVPLTNTQDNKDYVTTATLNGISYVIPSAGIDNYTEIQEYLTRMFSSDPAKREGANIMVLNGSQTAGLASTERDKLTKDHLKVGYVGDAPSSEYTGTIIYALNDIKPGTKALLESRYGVQVQSAENVPKGIITDGYDFVIILGNPKTDN